MRIGARLDYYKIDIDACGRLKPFAPPDRGEVLEVDAQAGPAKRPNLEILWKVGRKFTVECSRRMGDPVAGDSIARGEISMVAATRQLPQKFPAISILKSGYRVIQFQWRLKILQITRSPLKRPEGNCSASMWPGLLHRVEVLKRHSCLL